MSMEKIEAARRGSSTDAGAGFSLRSVVGILCMNAAILFWVGLNVATKVLYNTSNISAFEFSYFRCSLGLLMSYVYAKWKGIDVLAIPRVAGRDLFIRSSTAMFGFALGFWSLQLMSYSKFVSLTYVYPMITQIASYFILGERLTVYDFLGCAGSFLGVLIIETHSQKSSSTSNSEPAWAFIVPLVTAVFWAMGDVFQRKIRQHVHYVVSPMYQYLSGSILCAALGFVSTSYRGTYTIYTPRVFALLLLTAALGTAGTVMYAIAFQLEKAGRLSPIGYLTILYALVVGYFYFHDDLNVYSVVGAMLIMCGSFTIAVLKGCGFIS